MSEEFIKVTDGHTDGQTEPLPELLSELKIFETLYNIDPHNTFPVFFIILARERTVTIMLVLT